MKISVVIPTYNEEKYIKHCMNSLLNQTLPRNEYEIIIVDGGSGDNTVNIAKKLGAKVIKQKGKSIGGARNDGVYVAKSDIIATTDADAIMPKDWLEKILVNFNDPDVVFVSGSVFYPKNKWYKAIDKIDNIAKLFYYFFIMLNIIGFIPSAGANISFRKKSFIKIGGFKDLPVMDDYEMPFRIKKIGKRIYKPDIRIYVSDRRIRKYGFLNTHFYWMHNALRIILKKDVQNIKYNRQKY